MSTFFFLVLGAAMLLTAGSLALGLISMVRGDDPRRSNRFMQNRVLFQGAALAIFTVFMLMLRGGG